MTRRTALDARLRWIDLALAAVLTLLIVGLHVTFLRHAGALWRDEVQMFNLSTATTFAEAWQLNEHDTFPLLWQLALRSWHAVGLAGTDFGLRSLGLLIGLAMVAMLWYTVRQFGVRAPLVSLVIFALSPTVIVFGDSVRGYGFGMIWLLFLIGRLWRLVREPTRRNAAWAAGAALLAVQSFYFSVVFLAVLGVVSFVILMSRQAWRAVVLVVGVCLLAAVSMLPYLDVLVRQQRWFGILASDVSVAWLVSRLADAINTSGRMTVWVWVVLYVLALDVCVFHVIRRGSSKAEEEEETQDRNRFAGGMLVLGTIGCLALLLWRRHPTQVWYYIPLMGCLAVALEVSLAYLVERCWMGRVVRQMFAATMAVAVVGAVWPAVHTRMTNVDQIATHLNQRAAPGDLIVVNPWWPGVTFGRYYRGQGAWTTVPDLGPLPVQRFDLFRHKIYEKEPIAPIVDRIVQTLQGGGRVWIVGDLSVLGPGEEPGSAPPAPVGPVSEQPYMTVWSRQVAHAIQSHATRGGEVAVEARGPVSQYENFRLQVAEGWR